MRWHTLFHAGGADYFRVATFDQHRTFGMLGVMTRDKNGTKLIGLPLTGTHNNNPKMKWHAL